MVQPQPLAALSREELLRLVAELQRQDAALQRQVVELTADHEALCAEFEHLKRLGKRQAGPFAKGTCESTPKRPGWKPRSRIFRYREAPPPEALTEPLVDVHVPLDACPGCGGPPAQERVDFAYCTELPQRHRPHMTPYRVWVCRCSVCGSQVHGQHQSRPTGSSLVHTGVKESAKTAAGMDRHIGALALLAHVYTLILRSSLTRRSFLLTPRFVSSTLGAAVVSDHAAYLPRVFMRRPDHVPNPLAPGWLWARVLHPTACRSYA